MFTLLDSFNKNVIKHVIKHKSIFVCVAFRFQSFVKMSVLSDISLLISQRDFLKEVCLYGPSWNVFLIFPRKSFSLALHSKLKVLK